MVLFNIFFISDIFYIFYIDFGDKRLQKYAEVDSNDEVKYPIHLCFLFLIYNI